MMHLGFQCYRDLQHFFGTDVVILAIIFHRLAGCICSECSDIAGIFVQEMKVHLFYALSSSSSLSIKTESNLNATDVSSCSTT